MQGLYLIKIIIQEMKMQECCYLKQSSEFVPVYINIKIHHLLRRIELAVFIV